MVRKMNPTQALNVLRVTPKYAAKDLGKAIATVLANAKQAGFDGNAMFFKKLEIDESMKMRRFRAGTRGRAKPFKRRMAHIKIVISDQAFGSEAQARRVTGDSKKAENKKEKKETK